MRKRVVILGSTGCVGRKTLEVIRRHPDRFEVVALVAGRDVEGLAAQSRIFSPRCVALAHERHARRFLREIGVAPAPRLFTGEEGIGEIFEREEIDLVVSAIPGIAGLWPTLSAARIGCDIAIACKEAIVAGGGLLVERVRKQGGRLIPLDSEHNAIFRLLAHDPTPPRRIILTASGGPFLHREDLHGVTPEEAVRHPIWRMGPKISVDCATLMNKGLEIIEAAVLFELPGEAIEVLIHPEGVVHGFVEGRDATLRALLAPPDMAVPITHALFQGETPPPSTLRPLDLAEVGPLHFARPEGERFRAIDLAREALAQGGSAPAILSAADEEAVAAFLAHRIPFSAILSVVEETMSRVPAAPIARPSDLAEADREARAAAQARIARIEGNASPAPRADAGVRVPMYREERF